MIQNPQIIPHKINSGRPPVSIVNFSFSAFKNMGRLYTGVRVCFNFSDVTGNDSITMTYDTLTKNIF